MFKAEEAVAVATAYLVDRQDAKKTPGFPGF
jgi:hypothetical protein